MRAAPTYFGKRLCILRCIGAVVFFAALILLSGAPAALVAQWPSYPSPGVPKTADGKPNLNGPAPRTADGKPDLTGIWQNNRTVGGTVAARTSATPPASNEDLIAIARRSPFWNLGSQFKDGLPFTPWGAEVHRQRVANNSKDNPDAHCLPMGIMQFHNHGEPRKMIQTPQVIVILYEANAGMRQIFTDGRPLPGKDADPWWYGYSTGHWEGDTLVVQSAGFRDLGWLDVEGSPLSDAGKYHRALPPPRLRAFGYRSHHRRPQSLHQALDRRRAPAHSAGHRNNRVRLPGKRTGLAAFDCKVSIVQDTMQTLVQDVQYALRTLAASPGFVAAAVLSLALGIGANTAIFTLTDAVFLNPLPVQEASRVIEVYTVDHLTKATNNLGRTGTSWANFVDVRDQNQVFSGIAAFTFAGVSITGRGEPKPENAELVTANYFDVLGRQAVPGARIFARRRSKAHASGNPKLQPLAKPIRRRP